MPTRAGEASPLEFQKEAVFFGKREREDFEKCPVTEGRPKKQALLTRGLPPKRGFRKREPSVKGLPKKAALIVLFWL